MMVQRSFELRGAEGLGDKPRPDVIGGVLAGLRATLQDTVRMGFLHSSRTAGRIPAMLKHAAKVRYLGHTGHGDCSTILRFEVPEFGSVADELFRQGLLWDEGPTRQQTSFDLLATVLADVRRMARDSRRFDHPLLHRLAGYRQRFRHGLESIGLPDVQGIEPTQIDVALSRAAEELYRETPAPKRVRVAGRLDMLGVSERVMGLVLADGTPITGVWNTEPFTELAAFLDKQVVIEGVAVFRPSGALLRVDTDAVAYAAAEDAFFATLPSANREPDYAKEAARGNVSRGAYSAILGQLRGEESDEDFVRAVAAVS